MRATPFFSVLMGDARGYDTWARQIASGDWIGREVFYQAPLYPYFIGLIYHLFGADLLALRVAQAIVGSLSCVLLGYAGARWFSWPVGVAAGVGLAFYAPAIFFDGIVQKSVLDVFFMCATLALLGRLRSGLSIDVPGANAALERAASPDRSESARRMAEREAVGGGHRQAHSTWAWVMLGVVVGCLALTRENALLLVPVIGAWIGLVAPGLDGATAWRRDGLDAWRSVRRPLALFVLGLGLTLGPVALRNALVGGGVYLTTSQFGSNFYIGNNPASDGTYMSLRFGRGSPEYERVDATELAERALGRTLAPGEVSRYWTDRALAFITSQPGAWLRLQARKAALLVNATEMVDTESQEAHAEYSWPLRLLSPVTHFGLLVPLAAFGLIATRDRRVWVLYAIGLAYALSTVMFFVFARYRYPLVPLLLIFASAGLVRAWESWRTRRRPRGILLYGVPMLAALIANWPILSVDRMRAITATNLGTALYEGGRLADATDQYRRAMSIQPDYAPAYNNLGVALRAQGRVDEAIETYQKGLRLRGDYPDLHFNLANALMAENRGDEAAEHLREASDGGPESAAVHNNLGTALAGQGRLAEAVTAFERALALEPSSVQALRNLGNVLPELGRRAEALASLQRAVELAPADAEVRYDLGRLWLEDRRFGDAAAAFVAAVGLKPEYVEARNNLGIALASQGDIPGAIAQWEEALRIDPSFEDARRNLEMARKQGR